jgi:hypothetical protein
MANEAGQFNSTTHPALSEIETDNRTVQRPGEIPSRSTHATAPVQYAIR